MPNVKGLNQTIENVLIEVKKLQVKNSLIAAGTFVAIFPDLDNNLLNVKLTAEEEIAALATIGRIEAEEFLSNYMMKAQHSYIMLFGNKNVPEWLLQSGTAEDYFAEFFENVAIVDDPKFLEGIEFYSSITFEQAKAKYLEIQDLRVKETLYEAARKKINQAIDLRDFLLNTLKLFGYTIPEIEAVKA